MSIRNLKFLRNLEILYVTKSSGCFLNQSELPKHIPFLFSTSFRPYIHTYSSNRKYGENFSLIYRNCQVWRWISWSQSCRLSNLTNKNVTSKNVLQSTQFHNTKLVSIKRREKPSQYINLRPSILLLKMISNSRKEPEHPGGSETNCADERRKFPPRFAAVKLINYRYGMQFP